MHAISIFQNNSVIIFRNIIDFSWGKYFSIYFIQYFQLAIRLFIDTIQTADPLQIRRLVGSALQLRYQVRTIISWIVCTVGPSRRHIYIFSKSGRQMPSRFYSDWIPDRQPFRYFPPDFKNYFISHAQDFSKNIVERQ